MEAVVFILTSIICALVAFTTRLERKPNEALDRTNKRIQMLEYMIKRRLFKFNELSFTRIDHDCFHLSVDIDTTIKRIQLHVYNHTEDKQLYPEPTEIAQKHIDYLNSLQVYDVYGKIYTITSNCGIFDLEIPVHFKKIEFKYNKTFPDNRACLCFHHDDYEDFKHIKTTLFNGRHIISNVTKKNVDYEKIRYYFLNSITSVH